MLLSILLQASGLVPNVLLCIADDQSWKDLSIMQTSGVETPNIDALAKGGMIGRNFFCACPSSTPSRASILTGQEPYRLREAGLLFGSWPMDIVPVTSLLRKGGYDVAYTGKGYDPANHSRKGYRNEPIGRQYNTLRLTPPTNNISRIDYASNFEAFLKDNSISGRPFFFWMGSHEPHRPYEEGSGERAGKNASIVALPDYYPDADAIRGDITDYFLEIEWFDTQVGRCVEALKEAGELDNTLIIVTADNGRPFPRSKATLYEYGVHVPFVAYWKGRILAGRTVEDFLCNIDIAPTILELAGIAVPEEMTGKSMKDVLLSPGSGQIDPSRDHVVTCMERHAYSRPGGLPYPVRSVRKGKWAYLYNFEPSRYPAGDPNYSSGVGNGKLRFADIDNSPTKNFMMSSQSPLWGLCIDRRPQEELYDLENDPYQLHNLAGVEAYEAVRKELHDQLFKHLRGTADPRMEGLSPWDDYPFYANGFEADAAIPVSQRDTVINGIIYNKRQYNSHLK